MPSGRTNNFPESGHGLGHVTPAIFGSTVGYPSDSLASCYVLICIDFLSHSGTINNITYWLSLVVTVGVTFVWLVSDG